MMRYLLFTGDTFYPNGGVSDFSGRYASLDDLLSDLPKRNRGENWWAEVLDMESFERADIEWSREEKRYVIGVWYVV